MSEPGDDQPKLDLKVVGVALGASVLFAVGAYVYSNTERLETPEELARRLTREVAARGRPYPWATPSRYGSP